VAVTKKPALSRRRTGAVQKREELILDAQKQSTYDAIVARCKDLYPPVDIAKHIKPGTMRVAKSTLDGITFEAVDPADLEAELSGRMKFPGPQQLKTAGSAPCRSTRRMPARPTRR
jgi:hypothetical protein